MIIRTVDRIGLRGSSDRSYDSAFAMFSVPSARRKTLGLDDVRKASLGISSPYLRHAAPSLSEKCFAETVCLLQQFATRRYAANILASDCGQEFPLPGSLRARLAAILKDIDWRELMFQAPITLWVSTGITGVRNARFEGQVTS
jgi:hypothetical protein